MRSKIIGVLGWLLVGLLPGLAQQTPQTQCVASAFAGGTGDAITIPALPCTLTTNLLILTISTVNSTPTPTLQPIGLPAQPIVSANGGSIVPGQFTPGLKILLSPTGSQWVLIGGQGPQGPPGPAGGAQGPIGPAGPAGVDSSGYPPLAFNANTTFSLACDGSTDDATAFRTGIVNLEAANPSIALGAQLTLTLTPKSTSCLLKTCPTIGGSNLLFAGIKNLVFYMAGAKMDSSTSGACAQMGPTGGIVDAASTAALFQTSTAGALCATMVTSGQESRFPIGSAAIAMDDNMQQGGFPPNNAFYEYLTVQSTGNGQVCFTNPTINAYNSLYPDYNLANSCGTLCGGPATLFPLASGWQGSSVTIVGGTWAENTGAQGLYVIAQTVTWQNVTVTGGVDCAVFTMTQTVNTINSDFTGCTDQIWDKAIGTINSTNTKFGSIENESAQPQVLNFNAGSTVVNMIGGPKVFNCNNSSITNQLSGQSNYAAQVSFNGNACSIASISQAVHPTIVSGTGQTWVVAGGVFTNAISVGAQNWPVPGTQYNYFFTQHAGFNYEAFPFQVTGLSQSSPNFSISTTLPGGIPGIPTDGSGNISIAPDPYPNWNCTNCTGSTDAIDFSQAGAQNARLFTYSNRIYTCTNGVTAVQAAHPGVPVLDINAALTGPNIWGSIVSITVNVLQADTNTHATLAWLLGGQFANQPVINNVTGAQTTYSSTISLLTTGVRVITQSTTSGAQTGDTLNSTGNVSSVQVFKPYLGTSITGETAGTCPIVQETFQTSR